MDRILEAREERSRFIREYWQGKPLLIIKANVPGKNKNLPCAYFLVHHFQKLLAEQVNITRSVFLDSADGPYWLLETAVNKDTLIKLEEEHPLGRLIDLDLYLSPEKSISRRELALPPRKCLICHLDAALCVRAGTHPLLSLLEKIEEMIADYLSDSLKPLLDEAITAEAELDPKFGLVTPFSSGAHPDMDFSLLMCSKQVLLPYLSSMLRLGYLLELDEAFREARKLGIEAEQAMFRETHNINTYKGLHFVLGIVLLALGNCLRRNNADLFGTVKQLGKNLKADFQSEANTFGLHAYQQYKITGIRGEVINGLPNVQKVLPEMKDLSKETLLLSLCRLIGEVEDTVLLKRAGSLEKYHYYRKLIGGITTYDETRFRDLTAVCIEENLSFGGSADLLVVAIFLKKVEGWLSYQGEIIRSGSLIRESGV